MSVTAAMPEDDHPDHDRYHIFFPPLASGGMGVTYRAWDKLTGRPVVIKCPRREQLLKPGFLQRFEREVRTMRQLDHPHIVPIIDSGTIRSLPFYVMPFLPGGSLSTRRVRDQNGQPVPDQPSLLQPWLGDIAAALDHLHSRGVIHRDVKPGNILFDVFWHSYLSDFGIAKVIDDEGGIDREETLTSTHMVVGTQQYMAAEQFMPKHALTGAVDQYALAVTVYGLLAGRKPFEGDSSHLIVEIMTKEPPPLGLLREDLPAALVRAVHRGLAKRPQDRFASCTDFARAVLAEVPPLDDGPGVARLACPVPKCGHIIKIGTKDAGRRGACPKCSTRLVIAEDLSALWTRADQAIVAAQEKGQQPQGIAPAGVTVDDSITPGAFDFKPLPKPTPVPKPRRRKNPLSAKLFLPVAAATMAVGAVLLIGFLYWIVPRCPEISKDQNGRIVVDDGRLVVYRPKGFQSHEQSKGCLVAWGPSSKAPFQSVQVCDGDKAPSWQEGLVQVSIGQDRDVRVWQTTPTKRGTKKIATALKQWNCTVQVAAKFYTVQVVFADTGINSKCARSLCINIAGWLEAVKKPSRRLSGTPGFRVAYFADSALEKQVPFEDVDTVELSHNWGNEAPVNGLPADHFSIRWQGNFAAPADGPYFFKCSCDDGGRIKMKRNGKEEVVVDAWGTAGTKVSGPINLLKDESYPITIEYCDKVGPARMTIEWRKGTTDEWKVLGADTVSYGPKGK